MHHHHHQLNAWLVSLPCDVTHLAFIPVCCFKQRCTWRKRCQFIGVCLDTNSLVESQWQQIVYNLQWTPPRWHTLSFHYLNRLMFLSKTLSTVSRLSSDRFWNTPVQPGIPASPKNRQKPLKMSSTMCFRLSSEMFRMMKPVAHNISTLSNRHVEQCKPLFKQITNQSHILHRLFPAKRDAQLIGRLRFVPYRICHAWTARFLKSFVPYSLANFQWL